MAQNISTFILPPCAMTLTHGATAWVDVRLSDIADMRVFLTQTWPNGTSSGSTGLAVNLYPGWGGKDPAEIVNYPIPVVVSDPSSAPVPTVPVFAGNFVQVTQANGYTAINQPPLNQSGGQSTITAWYLNTIINTWPQWIRFEIYSLDSAKTCQVGLLADI